MLGKQASRSCRWRAAIGSRGSSWVTLFVRRGKPLLQCGHGAKCFGVDLPRNGRPEDRGVVCCAVDTYAVFRICCLFLQPQNCSVFRRLNVNEATLPGGVLECLEVFHDNLSLRSWEGRRWLCFQGFRPGYPSRPGDTGRARNPEGTVQHFSCDRRGLRESDIMSGR